MCFKIRSFKFRCLGISCFKIRCFRIVPDKSKVNDVSCSFVKRDNEKDDNEIGSVMYLVMVTSEQNPDHNFSIPHNINQQAIKKTLGAI